MKAKDRMAALMKGDEVARFHKKHKCDLVGPASQAWHRNVQRLPSGVWGVDRALVGGWVVGQEHLIWGPKSGGKTYLILKAIAQAQQTCMACVTRLIDGSCECGAARDAVTMYIDAEGSLNLQFAEQCGVDLDRVLLSRPEVAEQGWEVATDMLRTGNVDIIVIDSIAFMVPSTELEGDFGDANVGVAARLTGQGVRSFVSVLNGLGNFLKRRPTVFLTNQVRHNPAVMYGSPEVQPGGFAPGFAVSTEIRTRKGEVKIDKDTKAPLYADHHFKVIKYKWGPTPVSGAFRISQADGETKKIGDVIDEPEIIAAATTEELIVKEKSKWVCLGEEYRVKRDIEDRLLTDPHFRDRLVRELIAILRPV